MNEELSIHDMSVSLSSGGDIIVHGSGSPDGATVTVTVSIDGDGSASGSGTIVSGAFQIQINLQGTVGDTGTVEAGIVDSKFTGKEGVGYLNFELK